MAEERRSRSALDAAQDGAPGYMRAQDGGPGYMRAQDGIGSSATANRRMVAPTSLEKRGDVSRLPAPGGQHRFMGALATGI
jgi:hypothetical protein